MPIFTEIETGRTVDAAVAAFPDGRPKPGYRAQVGPGEYVHFNITMRDNAPGSGSVFLTDAAVAPFRATSNDSQMILDAEVEREVSRARSEHAERFAFLGDRAPAFNDDTARLVAASKLQHGWARSVRDAAYGQYTPSAPSDEAARAVSAQAMRNFARDSQY